MSGYDVVLMMALGAFLISGFVKGLFSKIFSLAALIIGIIICANYGKDIASIVSQFTGLSEAAGGIAGIAAVFIVLFIIAAVLARAFRKISIFRAVDKLGGAVFGLLEGALILSFFLLFLAAVGVGEEGPAMGKSYLYEPIRNFAPSVYKMFVPSSATEKYFDKFFRYSNKPSPPQPR